MFRVYGLGLRRVWGLGFGIPFPAFEVRSYTGFKHFCWRLRVFVVAGFNVSWQRVPCSFFGTSSSGDEGLEFRVYSRVGY